MEVDEQDGEDWGEDGQGVGLADMEWEEEQDDQEGADDFEEEAAWEPPPRSEPQAQEGAQSSSVYRDEDTDLDGNAYQDSTREAQRRAHAHLREKTFPIPYTKIDPNAGKPVKDDRERTAYQQYAAANAQNPYHPFASKLDWQVARWAKMRGPGSTAVTELLEIDEVSHDFDIRALSSINMSSCSLFNCSGFLSRTSASSTR